MMTLVFLALKTVPYSRLKAWAGVCVARNKKMAKNIYLLGIIAIIISLYYHVIIIKYE